MNTVLSIVIIILAVVVVIVSIIAVVSLLSGGKKVSEIHFSGGADVDSGRLSKDKNYFKGFSGSGSGADTIYTSQAIPNGGIYLTVKNLYNGTVKSTRILGETVFGREGDFVVNDKYVSRKQCKLFAVNGKLFLSNLSQSNSTKLNGKIVMDTAEIKSGSIINMGKTELEINF